MNFSKSGHLFNEGMKISVLSKKESEKNGTGWIRAGFNISAKLV